MWPGDHPLRAEADPGLLALPTENATAWEGVLRELWPKGGLRRVLLFITDGLPGMEEAYFRRAERGVGSEMLQDMFA
jgi:hypothetical protein